MKKTLVTFVLMLFTFHAHGRQYAGRMGEDPETGGPRREQQFFSRLYAPGITPQGLNRLWEEIHAMPSEDAQQTNPSAGWKCIGPFGFDVNYLDTNYAPTRWTGRVLDLELQPSGALRFAAASGGLWEAFFGAAPLSDGITSLRIGSFATKPGDRNTIIVGTGEEIGNGPLGYGSQGTGLWKTTDGGGSWRQLHTPESDISYVYKVRFHDIADGFVYAATNVGLFRSTDYGETWSRTFLGKVWDFAFAMRNVAGGGDEYRMFIIADYFGLYVSTDLGGSWTSVTQLPTTDVGRGSISAARPSGWSSSTIYVSLSPPNVWNDTLVGIYKSTDAGDTWSNVSPPLNLFGTRQSPYNNTLGVCPTNPDIALVGWMKMYRTTNGGRNWAIIDGPGYPLGNHDRTHDDWHEVLWTYGSRVYAANDGGIFYSDDYGYTWGPAFAYQVAPITQFYYFDVSPDNHDIIYGGAQDNGITGTISGGAGWLGTNCCDGAGVAIDYGGSNVFAIAGSLPYSGPRFRSTNYGINWSIIPPSGGLMPGKVIRLTRGSVSWLYTDNGNQVMTSADNGVTWYVLGGSGGSLPASINNLTVGNWLGGYGSEVYAALTNGQLWVNSQGTWFNRSAGLPAAIVHKVAIHPVYTGVGYALMEGISPILQSNKIFKTIDRGQTWVNITGNLPNLPITDLVAHPNNPNLLYLGTAMGCYKSTDGGATWIRWNFGMPEANIITEMSYIDSTTFNGKFYVLAASYGRSIWKREASTDDPNTTRVVSRRRIPIVGIGHALDTITVAPLPQGGGIRRLTFSLDSLLYSFDGDLIISLLHAGVRDTLVNRVGGEGRNFIGTILDDDATLSLSQGVPPFTGVFRPYEPLSRFNGLPPEGDWILDVHATRPGQAGTLIGWSMTISFGSISEVTQQSGVPEHFELEQNYPNPFNPSTKIAFSIPAGTGHAPSLLKVYDVLGREVRTLVNENLQAGNYEVTFDATGLASGVYLYRLQAGEFVQTRKLILLR